VHAPLTNDEPSAEVPTRSPIPPATSAPATTPCGRLTRLVGRRAVGTVAARWDV